MADQSNNLTTALGHHQAGRLDDAETIYREILAANAENADARHLLGMVFHARGDHAAAIELIAQAILISPSTAEFHANISVAYLAVGRSEEAISHGQRSVSLGPDQLESHYNLGNALFAQGAVDEAIECFDRARQLAPENIHAHTNFLFAINFSGNFDRQRICDENIAWGDALLAASAHKKPSFENSLVADRRLKIGYFLPEPGAHVSPRFLETLLRHHDREGFDVTVYEEVGQGGGASARLRDIAPIWRDLTGLTPAAQAAAIRDDGVDILNHTATYKARYRQILAHHAAPLQLASTNFMATTGLRSVDYVVTDPMIDPVGEGEDYYCENLIRLSRFNAYQPPADCPPISALPAREAENITFGSFNNVAKISSETLDLWAEILTKVPGARLILKHRALDDPAIAARFASALRDRGIAETRWRFDGFTAARADYLAAYDEIDIALDPIPFGGGTTSYEALWMGVPVVTIGGGGISAGQSAGAMTAAGIGAFIATSRESYVAIAVMAAADLDRLAAIRANLRGSLDETAFNGAKHVAELEDAYRKIWRDYVARQ